MWKFLRLGWCVVIGGSMGLWAQIGDQKGEVQKPLVPAEQIPPAPALTPEEALRSFKVAPGYKLEVAAADPLVQEPVAMTFGPDGRMWVVEMRGYMPDLDGNGEDEPVGRVVVLSDRDGDGRYDDSMVFVDGLILPRAIQLVADGVLVGAPPELAFFRDTDGDGKADKKDLVASDYGVRVDPKRPHLANPERAPNNLTWSFDNWIYSTAYTKKFRYVKGQWETGGTIFRGQWGLGQDDYGRLYYGSNSDSLRIDLIASDYLKRNPHYPKLDGTNVSVAENQLVWPARVTPGINRGYRPEMLRDGRLKAFTAACGWFVYRGDMMPEFYGNVFVAEPSAHFIRRFELDTKGDLPHGRNPYAGRQQEFIASTDERHRPVGFATGPDGALYVIDLYRGVLQHRISLTSYLRKQSEDRKLNDPQHLGRIYRVVPAGKTIPRVAKIAPLSTAQWVERLGHANGWWRETAQRILVERGDAAVVPAVRRLAESSPNAAGRVHALWALEGMNALQRSDALAALEHTDSIVRTAALRLSERFLSGDGRQALIARMQKLTQDSVPEVKLQAVLSLGSAADPAVDAQLANIVKSNPKNSLLKDALYSGVANREIDLIERLATDPQWKANDAEANQILGGLARGVLGSRDIRAVERILSLASKESVSGVARAGLLLDGLVPTTGASRRPIQLTHAPASWSKLQESRALKPRLDKLVDVIVWPGKTGTTVLAEVSPLTAEQQARFEVGKALYNTVCVACHQANGRGLDGLAPPLLDSEWILGPVGRPVRIVLQGVRGNIIVLGQTHTGDMPAFGAALDDQQIASILTYLRREWGHTASPVEPKIVKEIRAATASRADAWSAQELTQVK